MALIKRFPIRSSGMTFFDAGMTGGLSGYRIESGMTGGCFECRVMPGMKVAFIERFPIRSSGMTLFDACMTGGFVGCQIESGKTMAAVLPNPAVILQLDWGIYFDTRLRAERRLGTSLFTVNNF